MAVSNKQLLAITLGLAGLGLIGIGGLSVVAGPILTYPLAVELPKRVTAPSSTLQEPPARIELRVDSSNQVFWNNSPVAVAELQQRMEDEVRADSGNPPELRIAADPASDYEVVGKILDAARMARMKRIGFSQ